MEIIVLVLFAFVVIGFLAYRWSLWIINAVAEDLFNLFRRDENKWWEENQLPKAIGKSGFVTRVALKLLHEEVGLRQRVVLISGIRAHSLYPRVDEGYPVLMLLVQLDSDGNQREKKTEDAWIRQSSFKQSPIYSATLSLRN